VTVIWDGLILECSKLSPVIHATAIIEEPEEPTTEIWEPEVGRTVTTREGTDPNPTKPTGFVRNQRLILSELPKLGISRPGDKSAI
jgi:hypothetical protein